MCKMPSPFFKHDCNARRDERMLALRHRHGWKGYGIFWAIIELLSETPDYNLPADYGLLSIEAHAPCQLLQSIIEDFGLFVIYEAEGQTRFHAKRLSRDMEAKDKASQNAREKVEKRWSRNKTNVACNTENEISNTEIEISNTENEISNTKIEISNTNKNKSKNKSKNKEYTSSLRSEDIPSNTHEENENLLGENDPEDIPPIEVDRTPKIGMNWVLPMWGEICPHLAQPKKLDADRVRALTARAKQSDAKTSEEFQQILREQFQRVADSDFLSGRTKDNFRASFDWLVKHKNNWQKVDEGNYTNHPHQQAHTPQYVTTTNIHASPPSDIALTQQHNDQIKQQLALQIQANQQRIAQSLDQG